MAAMIAQMRSSVPRNDERLTQLAEQLAAQSPMYHFNQ
jgi:hypothetical protein